MKNKSLNHRIIRNNYRAFILLIAYVFCFLPAFAQADIWKKLTAVTFRSEFDKQVGYPVQYPVFTPDIKALNGKIVTIKGYIVPMNESKGYFALSMNPFQTCYFCGGAGIETVLEVYGKKEFRFTNQQVNVKGKLKLNDFDIMNHLIYILEDAEIVK